MTNADDAGKARRAMDADDFVIIGAGLVTTVLTLLLARFLDHKNFTIITWMVWWIVPLGAVLLGGLSSLGFMIGAVKKQKKMSLFAAILMVLILVPAYFAHYQPVYDSYAVEPEVDGEYVPLSEVMNFWEFYIWEMKSRVYTDFRATEDEAAKAKPAGNMGYLYALLEIGGFLFGGFAVLVMLSQFKYCDSCHRYFQDSVVGMTTRQETAQQTLDALNSAEKHKILQARSLWQPKIPVGESFKAKARYTFTLNHCKGCYEDTVAKINAQATGSNDTKEIATFIIPKDVSKELLIQK